MQGFQRALGYVWAAPLTLAGLLYVAAFTAVGWCRYTGRWGDAWVWNTVHGQAPRILESIWLHWSGHTMGNVVLLKLDARSERGSIVLRHELEHVRQCMVLGPLQPVLYCLAWLSLSFCRHGHPHYDNPFEVDARRAAGQIIDVVGSLKRAVADGRIALPGS